MKEITIVERTHQIALENPKKDIAIDATCGNGYDALFLASYYKMVIGIDIQDLAIKRSIQKTIEIKNIKIEKNDFNNIDSYKYANFIIFNLGFLPGSNRKIKTQDYNSDNAILKAYSILDGTLVVAAYLQHEGGLEEYKKIIQALKKNKIPYKIEDDFQGKEILIVIERSK